MLFIIKTDFYTQIPEILFNKLIALPDNTPNDDIWINEVPRAIELMKSYLRARYDVDLLFAPFKEYNDTDTFALNDRIIWTEDLYDETETYNTNQRISYSDKIYRAKEDLITGAFDLTKWEYLAENENKYYCTLESIGNLPSDIGYWYNGDNRNHDLVAKLIDICLYDIYSRLHNSDIPNIRKERYDGNDSKQIGGSIGWLKSIAKGHIQPDFPLLSENQENQTGNIVMYGYGKEVTDKNSAF